jgi:hypothetical protein
MHDQIHLEMSCAAGAFSDCGRNGSLAMNAQPDIGEWYRIREGEQFEVVAIDEDDGTIEVQYFDGTVEELDIADWARQHANGDIEDAEAPDDWSGSIDGGGDDDDEEFALDSHIDNRHLAAGGLDGLDLFESSDYFQ